MENSHDTILIIIIGAIIFLQIYVFWRNYQKIQDYKKTIQNVKDFKIVEVSVPEEIVKSIEVDKILGNPEAFQNVSSEFSSKMTEFPDSDLESDSLLNDQDKSFHEEEEFSEELLFPEDYDGLKYEKHRNKKNKL